MRVHTWPRDSQKAGCVRVHTWPRDSQRANGVSHFFWMSRSSFAFSSYALRSLQSDADYLEIWELRKRSRLRVPRCSPHAERSLREPLLCTDPIIHNALFSGDLDALKRFVSAECWDNLVIPTRGHELTWDSQNKGIWSMTYEEEFTCPLYVTANRGYTDCLQLLLKEGADVDFAPGGESALHGACENSQVECVKILLRYGANPNAGSQEGTQPLHRCKTPQSYHCAKLLIQYGAHVNSQSEDEEQTPLHVAARHGLHELVDLYLRYGASVNKKDLNGLTPLCAACNQPQSPQDIERYYQVCQNLIQNGANIRERDHDQQSPLHLACKNANPHVVDMLLDHGAEVNTMSYSGNTALQNILQVTAYKLENHPELIVRSLLNHGAVRVWPGSLIKVLRYCCSSPRTVEVLLNSYTKVKVTEEWAQVVPEEAQKTIGKSW